MQITESKVLHGFKPTTAAAEVDGFSWHFADMQTHDSRRQISKQYLSHIKDKISVG